MTLKKTMTWLAVAAALAVGYALGAREEPAQAQDGGTDAAILRELETISNLLVNIERCVGPHGYRSYGCEIEVRVR